MVEIEDRGLRFTSWKAYAKFLEAEVRMLQQFLPSDKVKIAFEGAKRKKLKGDKRIKGGK